MDSKDTSHEANPSETQEAEIKASLPDEDVLRKEISHSENNTAAKQDSNGQYQDKTIEKSDKDEIVDKKVMKSEENQQDSPGLKASENDYDVIDESEMSAGKGTQSDQEDAAGIEKQESTENTKLVTYSKSNQTTGVDKEDVVIDIEFCELGETESGEESKVPINAKESVSSDSWVKVNVKDKNESGCITEGNADHLIVWKKGRTADLSNVQANYKVSKKETYLNACNKKHGGCETNDHSVPSTTEKEQQQRYNNNFSQTEQETEKDEKTENGEEADNSSLKTYSTGDDNDHNRNIDISSVHGSEDPDPELIKDEKEKEHKTSADERELEFKNQLDSLSPVNDIHGIGSDHPLSEKNVSEQNIEKELETLHKKNKTNLEALTSQADYLNNLKAENNNLKKGIEESKLQLDSNREDHQQEIETMKTEQQNILQQKEQFWSDTFGSMHKQIEKLQQQQLRLQTENNENVEQIGSLQVAKQANEQIINSLKEKISQMDKEIKRLEKDKEKGAKIMRKRNEQITELTQKLAHEKERQTAVQQELNSEKDKTNQMQKNIKIMNQQYKTEWNRREHEHHANMETRKAEYENIIRTKEKHWEDTQATLNQKIIEQRTVHENLLLRYSKLAGESLTVGNANVTDLSDPNRPTKLAEQFSELYDNEWTDAFEELDNISDLEKISYLLLILQRAYELSSEITTSEWLCRCYFTTFTKNKDSDTNVCESDFETNEIQKTEDGDPADLSDKENTSSENEKQRTKGEDSFEQSAADNTSSTNHLQTIGNNDSLVPDSMGKGDPVQESQSAESDTGPVKPAVAFIDETNEIQKTENDDIADQSDTENTSSENEKRGTKDEDTFEQSDEDTPASKNDQEIMGNDISLTHDIEEKLDPTNDIQTIGNDDSLVPDSMGKGDPIPDHQKMENNNNRSNCGEEKYAPKNDEECVQDDGSLEGRTDDIIASGADLKAGSSVDPPIETIMKNKEPVRKEKLNFLEVPNKESKNERELQTIKMFTHIKKKVLSSASEQLQNVITDCLVEEFSIPTQTETPLMVFVKKCGEVCLMMGLKDPPVYVDFMKEGVPDKTRFNADQYKAYTRKGKYLQYVVWPCLFLEKDGPLLSKGTAQGKDD